MRLAPALICVLVTCGCASAPAEKKALVGYRFTGGEYSKLLEEAFREDAYSGGNFFVLPNFWNHVEPNGLLISPGRVRYVWVENGRTSSVDMTPVSCPPLGLLLAEFDTALIETMAYAIGSKAYPDLTPDGDYLDSPDYVIEMHGENANVVIDPKGAAENFPLIAVALKITNALKQCNDS